MYSPISEPFWSIVNFVSVIPKSFEFMPNFTAKPWIELRSKELDFAICSHDFSLRRPQLSPAWIVFLRAQFSRTMRVRSFESCVCVPLSTTHNQDFQIDFYTRATCNFLFISSSLMMIRNESDFRAEKFLGLKAYLLSLGSTFKYGTFLISSAGFEGISVLQGCLITYRISPLASLQQKFSNSTTKLSFVSFQKCSQKMNFKIEMMLPFWKPQQVEANHNWH